MRTIILIALTLTLSAVFAGGTTEIPIAGHAEYVGGKLECYCPSEVSPPCLCQYDNQEPVDDCDFFRALPTYDSEDNDWIYLYGELIDTPTPVVDMMVTGNAMAAISKGWCTE